MRTRFPDKGTASMLNFFNDILTSKFYSIDDELFKSIVRVGRARKTIYTWLPWSNRKTGSGRLKVKDKVTSYYFKIFIWFIFPFFTTISHFKN